MKSVYLDIPQQHPSFSAHFPGNPIVPGALLLQWIMAAAKHCGVAENISGVKNLKFLEVVKPGDRCRIKFETGSEQIKVICLRGDRIICKGTLGKGENHWPDPSGHRSPAA